MFIKRELRVATLKDLRKIMNLETLCFPDVYTKELKEIYKKRIEIFSEGFYILEYKNRIIGFVTTEIWNKDQPFTFRINHKIERSLDKNGTILYISSLNVHPKYSNQGLGYFILNEAIKIIKEKYPKINEVVLIVNEKWKNAIHLYEKSNFKNTDSIKRFFSTNKGLIYKKEI